MRPMPTFRASEYIFYISVLMRENFHLIEKLSGIFTSLARALRYACIEIILNEIDVFDFVQSRGHGTWYFDLGH